MSFGPAANANTSFGVTCTNLLPYTVAIDATSGTLLGLNYTLTLTAPPSPGNGLERTGTIAGNMAAGQSGICATGVCFASETRTLTITY
jgi:hypothetical protein